MERDPLGTWARGDWIQTYTGRQFWPSDPRAEDIEVADIAHALSNLCRFGGHCGSFYSVAQHSCLVADIVPDEHKKWALLHDASEAYLVDLPKPIKRHGNLGAEYMALERIVMAVVCDRFGLTADMPPEVRAADDIALVTEKRDLMAACSEPWTLLAAPLEHRVLPLGPADSEALFLDFAWELGII